MFAFSRRTHDEDEDADNGNNAQHEEEEKKPQTQPRKRKPPAGAVDKPEKPPMLVRDANTKQLKVNPALLGSPPPPHRVPGPSCVKCCVTRYRCGVAETRNIEVPKDYLSGTMTMEWQERFLDLIDAAAGQLGFSSAVYQLQWVKEPGKPPQSRNIELIVNDGVAWQEFCNSVLRDPEHRIYI